MTENNLTEQLAQQAISYRFDDLPDDVVRIAKLAILDQVGCTVRGAREPLAEILSEESFGRAVTADEMLTATVNSASLTDITLVRAAAGHAIDFDDTLLAAHGCHAGTPIVSAVLTLANTRPVSGKSVIEAIVAGFEVDARVAKLLTPEHYFNGFHSTSSLGVFGVAAACGKVLGLNQEQMQTAFGIAATQASGIKCVFGTMSKPFNAGKCSANGLLAARLAARGFTSSQDAIEADKGYLELFLGKESDARTIADASKFKILGNGFKLHAACHATHPMIEAINAIKSETDFGSQDVAKLEVSVSELALKTASIGEPTTGLEGKFSFPHTAALTVCGFDTAADSSYEDDILKNTELAALRGKVISRAGDGNPSVTRVTIDLKDGTRLAKDLDFRALSSDLGLLSDSLEAKYAANTEGALEPTVAANLARLFLQVDASTDVGADVKSICGVASDVGRTVAMSG